MKKNLLIFFMLLVIDNCMAQCAANCVGTYRVRNCGADTAALCVATIQQINPTKIVIRNFVCAYNYFNAYDTIIADLDCVSDSLHLEEVSYTDNNAPLSFWGRGIMTTDSIKIICGQMSPAGVQNVCYVYDNKTTGISIIEKPKAVLKIHPNPAQNNFTIETNANEDKTLQLFDVNGKQVFSQTINGTINIDANNLNAGVYSLNITSNQGSLTKKLVIVK